MSFRRPTLQLAGLVALAAVAAGCGAKGLAPAARVAGAQGFQAQAAGKPGGRFAGFDVQRYRTVNLPNARPRQLPSPNRPLPASVDLRAKATPIYDQGELGSCTAYAVAKGLGEFRLLGAQRPTELSGLFLYYEARKLRGNTGEDSGSTVSDALKAAAAVGMAPEATWPYDMMKFAEKPPAAAYKAAKGFKIQDAVQLAGVADMKKALAAGQMVVFGMYIFRPFRDLAVDTVPMPGPRDVPVGGHAIAVVGYDDARQAFLLRNSFGRQWGKEGHAYLPYAYCTPERVMDIWTAPTPGK